LSQTEFRPSIALPLMSLPAGAICPRCGYDLRGLTSSRCPECGLDVTSLRAGITRIPWELRTSLGRWPGYWRTVWQVVQQPREFCLEIARPVSYANAQSFYWITAAWVYLAVGATFALDELVSRLCGQPTADVMELTIIAGWGALVLALIPNLVSDFFRVRDLSSEHQTRAAALSYYAWAPLALMPLTLVFFVSGALLEVAKREIPAMVLGLTGLLAAAALVLLCCWRIFQFGKYTLRLPVGRRVRWGIALVLATSFAIVVVTLAPMAAVYVFVILQSLW